MKFWQGSCHLMMCQPIWYHGRSHRPILPHDVDGKLRDLIQACWNSNPSFRPTAMEACRALDGLRSLNTHYSGVLHLAMNPKKFLNSTRAILHHMMHFFCLDGQTGFKQYQVLGIYFNWVEWSQAWPHVTYKGCLCTFALILLQFKLLEGYMDMKMIMCKWLRSKLKVANALKIFKNCEGQEHDPSFKVELDFLVKLNHPHIVQLIGYCIDHFRTSIVLEWLPNDLWKLIEYQKETQKTRQPFSQFEAKALIIRIAKGLALCIVNMCSIGI
jgi:hypothetical protein